MSRAPRSILTIGDISQGVSSPVMNPPHDPDHTPDSVPGSVPPVEAGGSGAVDSSLTAAYLQQSEQHSPTQNFRAKGDGDAADVGAVIGGRYTLVKVIGEGGMGSVYLAEQREPVKRDVALKLIKAGLDSASVLRRFEAERQALALM